MDLVLEAGAGGVTGYLEETPSEAKNRKINMHQQQVSEWKEGRDGWRDGEYSGTRMDGLMGKGAKESGLQMVTEQEGMHTAETSWKEEKKAWRGR